MLKGAQLYKDADGWGWGRWRSEHFEPYGRDAGFVNECTGCHMPVRGDDHVYTLPMTTAAVPGEEIVNNQAAALPTGLPYQPLDWNPVTMFVDPQTHTMSALYGNSEAILNASSHGSGPSPITYAPGSVLALVTWVQRDDPHLVGGRIPGSVQSVEFVQVEGAGKASRYQRFSRSGEEHLPEGEMAKRTSFLLDLAPAWLPSR
jgi:hypothetical protein